MTQDALVCSSLSRLSRNVRDFSELLDWFERAGADLVLLDAPVDTTTANGRLAARTFANAVAWEREILSEKDISSASRGQAAGKGDLSCCRRRQPGTRGADPRLALTGLDVSEDR